MGGGAGCWGLGEVGGWVGGWVDARGLANGESAGRSNSPSRETEASAGGGTSSSSSSSSSSPEEEEEEEWVERESASRMSSRATPLVLPSVGERGGGEWVGEWFFFLLLFFFGEVGEWMKGR